MIKTCKNILVLGEVDIGFLKKNTQKLNIKYFFEKDLENTKDINIIITRGVSFKLNQKYLLNFINIKCIIVVGVGTDNIDLEYCKLNKIKVLNSPKISSYSVSELTVSMLLMGIRGGIFLGNTLKNKKFLRNHIGTNLDSINIGILGYGNIGKITVSILNSFKLYNEFNISVYDTNHNSYDEFLDKNNIKIAENEKDFFSKIDYLVIHINGKVENSKIINMEILENHRIKGIVNTSRALVVDEDAVLKSLERKLEFYIADVIDGENRYSEMNQKLINHPKVYITPHIGAHTSQVQIKLLNNVVSQVKECIL